MLTLLPGFLQKIFRDFPKPIKLPAAFENSFVTALVAVSKSLLVQSVFIEANCFLKVSFKGLWDSEVKKFNNNELSYRMYRFFVLDLKL